MLVNLMCVYLTVLRQGDKRKYSVNSFNRCKNANTKEWEEEQRNSPDSSVLSTCMRARNFGYSDARLTTFFFHVHDFPKAAAFSFILGSCIACPPITVGFFIIPVFHIRTKNSWDPTLATRNAGGTKIRSVKPKGDIDAIVRRFHIHVTVFSLHSGMRRSEHINS